MICQIYGTKNSQKYVENRFTQCFYVNTAPIIYWTSLERRYFEIYMLTLLLEWQQISMQLLLPLMDLPVDQKKFASGIERSVHIQAKTKSARYPHFAMDPMLETMKKGISIETS